MCPTILLNSKTLSVRNVRNVTQRTDTHIFTGGGTQPQCNPKNGHTIFAKLRQSSSHSWPELSLIFSVSHPPTHPTGKSFQDILAKI